MIVTRRHFAALSLAGCATPLWAGRAPLVFAAASLKAVLDRVSAEIMPLRLSYGGSGALARQIIAGAPADVFLSANPVWMDAVADAIPVPERRDLLGNRLVLVSAAKAEPISLREWRPKGAVAMGFLRSVPSGQYGQSAFEALGTWDAVQPHVIEVESVSSALNLVARGAVPHAVVYDTDARAEPRVDVVAKFGADLHDEIRYPLALLQESARPAYDGLSGDNARAIYSDAGFSLL